MLTVLSGLIIAAALLVLPVIAVGTVVE